MSGLPAQLPWKHFVRVLRDLGYRPLKPHRGSPRYFFSPTRSSAGIDAQKTGQMPVDEWPNLLDQADEFGRQSKPMRPSLVLRT